MKISTRDCSKFPSNLQLLKLPVAAENKLSAVTGLRTTLSTTMQSKRKSWRSVLKLTSQSNSSSSKLRVTKTTSKPKDKRGEKEDSCDMCQENNKLLVANDNFLCK